MSAFDIYARHTFVGIRDRKNYTIFSHLLRRLGKTMAKDNNSISDDAEITSADMSILDEQTREIIDRMERDPFLNIEMTPAEMRVAFDNFYANIDYPAATIASMEERDIPGNAGPIVVRIYHPEGSEGLAKPVCVFFHGGGMMMGSLAAYDGLCRRLAEKSGCIIVSASYRLAPENKFPAAVEDAVSVVKWASANASVFGGDQQRLAIAGESGGGYLAAAVTHIFRDEGDNSILFQLLINPAVGIRKDSESMKKYGTGYSFDPEVLDWFYSQYLEDMSEIDNPLVSPVLSPSFEGLPPAFITVAGVDILRSDIELYVQHLKDAGVPVETSTYETTIHGFTVMAGVIDHGITAIDECGAKLAAGLNK